MSGPATDRSGDGATAESHISVVLFLGDRAYKFPKPLRFGFIDQSTPERREAACAEEVRLNRRLAPDVYLGPGRLRLEGETVEHCVVMRRLPEDRRLSTLVVAGGGTEEVRSVARRLAAFHAAAQRGTTIAEAGSPESVKALWDTNLTELASDPNASAVMVDLERIGVLADRYLTGRTVLLGERQASGCVCDGHGDLLADDIFCLDDGPRILDCLAFADRFRHGDVLLDLAFLAMDLERLGSLGLAEQLISDYAEFTDEHHPSSLASHYVAYRALVRAKIAWLRVPDVGAQAEQEARALLALCRRHLESGRVRLVLVGGPPGTGKSTIAGNVGDTLGWSVLSSDDVRKEMGGRRRAERGGDALDRGLYSPERNAATYAALLERAGHLLKRGESVVLDASWARSSDRLAAADVASGAAADLIELVCSAPPEAIQRRVRDRVLADVDVSDADEVIAARLAQRFVPWPTATTIATDGERSSAAAAAVMAVQGTAG